MDWSTGALNNIDENCHGKAQNESTLNCNSPKHFLQLEYVWYAHLHIQIQLQTSWSIQTLTFGDSDWIEYRSHGQECIHYIHITWIAGACLAMIFSELFEKPLQIEYRHKIKKYCCVDFAVMHREAFSKLLSMLYRKKISESFDWTRKKVQYLFTAMHTWRPTIRLMYGFVCYATKMFSSCFYTWKSRIKWRLVPK